MAVRGSDSEVQKAYQDAARKIYDEDAIKISGDVMAREDGAFVEVWVWVPKEALGTKIIHSEGPCNCYECSP